MKRDEGREKLFNKRYGKMPQIFIEHKIENNQLVEYTLKFVSKKEYVLTEILKDGATEKVLLKHGDKTHSYTRFVDAELSIADLISEE